MRKYSEFIFGDMILSYILDDGDRMSMALIPAGKQVPTTEKDSHPEPMVQIHARGDRLPNGYGNGHTLACTPASSTLRFVCQERHGNTVETVLDDGNGRTVRHRAAWEEGLQALRFSCC